MSFDIYVFLKQEQMPAPAAWADAIKANGFDMELDREFDVVEHFGYLPCTFAGQETGFEYEAEETDPEELQEDGVISEDEVEQLGERDFLVTFTLRSDPLESVAASVAAGVLASMANGIVVEMGLPPFIPAGEALKWARECLQNYTEETGKDVPE